MGSVSEQEGIVLSLTDVGEEDRILTILTRDAGLLRAAAGSARNLGKGKAGALDLFVRTRLFIRRSSKGGKLPRIREVELAEPFLGIRQDYGRLCAASYVAEVVSRCVQEDDPMPGVFDLVSFCFLQLERGAPLYRTLLFFEVRLLKELGLAPEMSQCVKCGREMTGPSVLIAREGGVAHPQCAGQGSGPALSAGDTATLRFILQRRVEGHGTLKIKEKDACRLFAGLRLFSVHHLGFAPGTAALLPELPEQVP